MKIFSLNYNSTMYTSNVYLITGTKNSLADINTLVDVGRDSSIFERIENISTGLGKCKVEQVVLTHSHYDHAFLLPQIKETFDPVVYAFSTAAKGVDEFVKNGTVLQFGDRMFEVIYTSGHSNDSICLYCEEDGVLFTGDVPIIIKTTTGTYDEIYFNALKKISRLNIAIIKGGQSNG